MSKERRKHERFPLAVIAKRITDDNQEVELKIMELSVGGCFAKWFEEASPGYSFQMMFPLLNGGWMPVSCRVRYRYMTVGVGIQFVDIPYSEQEPIAEVIMNHLWREGLPEKDPFAPPETTEEPRHLEEEADL